MTDLRFAVRQLLKNPGFTAVAVITLALGIGANTVVFSVAKSVLFRPLGFAEAGQLVWIQLANRETGGMEGRLSWRELEDIRENTASFEGVGTFGSGDLIWERGDQSAPVPSLRVTPNMGELLRVRAVLGRMLRPADADEFAEPVVMISHELWNSQFQGNPEVLGRTVRLEGKSHTVVGVLPPGLEFPLERAPSLGTGGRLGPGVKSFWLPMSVPRGEDRTSRNSRMFLTLARMKAGVTKAAARAELSALGRRLADDHPETNRHWTLDLVGFRDQLLGRTRQGIPLLAVAVAAVLLICCVNLANLLLARGVSRQRELAVRLALGAGRRRIVRDLMAESLCLAVLGGGLGILLAQVSLHGIRLLASESVPFVREASLDAKSLAFTLLLSALTAGLFGLLPALRQSRLEVAESLCGGARMTGGPQSRVWQRGLLVAQIAIVLVLLTSAGLLLESFRRLVGQDLGYQPGSVVALDIGTWGFDTNGDVCRMYRRMRERLASLPGVEAVGTISSTPLTGKWTFDEKPQVVGRPLPEADRPAVAATFVAFDYFQAMGIPLVDGRLFRENELKDDGYGQGVIVNEAAANLLFPGRSAVGGQFTVGSNPGRVLEVVGVVKDTRDVQLEMKPPPRFYWQYAFGGAQVVVRSSAPANAILPQLREVAQQTDSRVVVHDVRPMSEIVSSTVAERRFLMVMVSTYAVVALGIALVGIFGVLTYQVAQRTNEFGIRLALGSSPFGLVRFVLGQVLLLVAAGVLLGLLISLGTGRLLASQLFDLTPHDPWLLGGVSLMVLGASLAAGAYPARRAGRVDPMVALRAE